MGFTAWGSRLANLKIKLEVMHTDDVSRAVHFHRHRIAAFGGRECRFVGTHVERSQPTAGRPEQQLCVVSLVSSKWSSEIAVDEGPIGSPYDINGDIVFVDHEGHFLRGWESFERGL